MAGVSTVHSGAPRHKHKHVHMYTCTHTVHRRFKADSLSRALSSELCASNSELLPGCTPPVASLQAQPQHWTQCEPDNNTAAAWRSLTHLNSAKSVVQKKGKLELRVLPWADLRHAKMARPLDSTSHVISAS